MLKKKKRKILSDLKKGAPFIWEETLCPQEGGLSRAKKKG